MDDAKPLPHFNDASHLTQTPVTGGFVNPPSAIAAAVDLGKLWAEDLVDRLLRSKRVEQWPEWPSYDAAPKRSRRHASKLVAAVHVHVAHPRTREKELRRPEAIARRRRAADALVRLCYETARTRYAELAAWRLR